MKHEKTEPQATSRSALQMPLEQLDEVVSCEDVRPPAVTEHKIVSKRAAKSCRSAQGRCVTYKAGILNRCELPPRPRHHCGTNAFTLLASGSELSEARTFDLLR